MKQIHQLVALCVSLCLVLIFTLISSSAQTGGDFEQAYKLYLQVIRGEKKFQELT